MLTWNYPEIPAGFSCHNHTSWSDGSGTLEEICRKGKDMGLKVLGISDHWVKPPFPGTDADSWSMDLSRTGEYVAALQKLKAELEDENFKLLIGLEVDVFPENIGEVIVELQKFPLDYMIGSVHYSGTFAIDYSPESWKDLSEKEMDDHCNVYYDKLEVAAARSEFAFIGHLDLPKKFGFIDNKKYFRRAVKVLDILKESGGAIELNTAGFYKECTEQYPALEILQQAYKRQIPVIINADAHCPEHLMRGFDQARRLLQQAGYK
ncbi:MAG: histidinol-phosphatase [Lentisphaeria bacterium]|nr:histidinol-phosphatase [Lentisphaeria bacterium]